MSLNNEKSPRKEYHSPRLVAFGDIRQLTQASNITGLRQDNANGLPPFKSQAT
ncbi:MAG: hypothetical protein WBV73_05565 [Phormidium sp.]